MTAPTVQQQRIAEHYDRAVADLVEAHAKLKRSPLVLAVRFDDRRGLDVKLLEVIERFPGEDTDPLFTSSLAPNERFLIMGTLHLTLASPKQLENAIQAEARGEKSASSEIVNAVRRHGQVEFLAKAPAARARKARALRKSLGLE